MKKNIFYFSIITYFIISIPFVFLPFGFDYSIFWLGGKILNNGGKLYVDFIDIKPPLLYYSFSILYFLFKNNILLYQIFNTSILIFTAITINKLTTFFTQNQWLGFLSPIPFLFFIASFNYNYIFEPELVFSLIFCLIALLLFKKSNSIFHIVVAGILSGIAFGLKYSFGIIVVPTIIYLITESQPQARFKLVTVYLLSFFITSFIPFFILYFQNGSLKDFIFIWNFLNYYQSTSILYHKNLKRISNNLEIILGVHYSLVFSFAFFYSVWNILKGKNDFNLSPNKYHNFLLISLCFIFLSIVVEHQFLNYHFIRISSISSIYSGLGIYLIFKEAKSLSRKLLLILIPIAIFFIIFYTPLPRYSRTAIPTFLYFTNKEKYIDYFENPTTANTLLRQHTTIANYINTEINPSDTVIIIGGAAQIYTMLRDCRTSAFPTSVFILSNFKKPNDWEERFVKELNSAKYIVIQDFDHTHFFGKEISSWEAFNQNEKYKKILESKYKLTLKTFSFYVYKRRN
ncbi:MAG: hypothetical protein N2560_04120 [Ignavibacteria bacterium]|nr:hypothetical protein [Ignavibacteria bacterium]